MTARLAALYRHPVKSLGEEALEAVTLTPGAAMPWDRAWAVAHGGSVWDPAAPGWQRCSEFVTQRHVPALAQLDVAFDEAEGLLTLRHPARPDLAVRPGTAEGAAALTAWLEPLAGAAQPGPYRIAEAPGVAFTDGDDCHLSLAAIETLSALGDLVGQPLEPIRFRMNLWLEGVAPWSEFDLVGQEIGIGDVRLKVISRCERCNSTNASPATGERDTQISPLLRKTFGHMDMGVNAQVVAGGRIRRGDAVTLP